MITDAENALYTDVRAGTPTGELLRRYWRPIAPVQELTAERPTKFVRIFGEDLVLFLDKSGRVGLVGDHCPHRGASLLYGRVEERGIACAYHGWLIDVAGCILETPPERNRAIIHGVRHKAYPVQPLAGLYWAYLGPAPAPAIPRFDVLARTDGHRRISVYPILDCNWFVAAENAVDPAHAQVLHQDAPTGGRRRPPVNTTRGYTDDIASYDFYRTWYGIMKRRVYVNGTVEEHPAIFPFDLRTWNSIWLRTPIDETHTYNVVVSFYPGAPAAPPHEPEVEYVAPYKQPVDRVHPDARYNLQAGGVLPQDAAMWETQGPVGVRDLEHLSYSDRGVVMLRRMMKESLDAVRRGQDPIGVVRDPDHPMIDTGLNASEGINTVDGTTRPGGWRAVQRP